MIRSGNPELDIALERFCNKIIRKMQKRDSKHGMQSLTRNGNKPGEDISLNSIANHLDSEYKELTQTITLVRAQEEVVDLAAMCFIFNWTVDLQSSALTQSPFLRGDD